MQILVSTGALIGRPNGRNFRLLKDFKNELNCDGFEFMMYSDFYDKISEIIDFTQSIGLNVPTFHCQKSIGEAISKGGKENFSDAFDRFEKNAAMAQKMGARKLIMHLWDGITSDRNIKNNIDCYKWLREIADKNGMDLLIENVICNTNTPVEHWNELHDKYKDVHFIFDTKMADFHGQLDLLYIDEYDWLYKEGLLRHFHVNDYGGGYMDWNNLKVLPIGDGHIDFSKFFAYIKKIGYDDTLTIESTAFDSTGVVNFDMLNRQIELLKKEFGKNEA